ncbi:hypothetical protein B0H16DRAFT_1741765 [Mycena metata]|uniref:Uncharacterized protein n=1 Tax=Mycena metata TaxID=1033252 RepID=A0AAD7MFY3_9AGAR|nr:hypothetical protein B0H16DRAFT_1741765 [Mycena metata]
MSTIADVLPQFYGPWYLTNYGTLVLDGARAREQTEDPPMSDPFEQSDYPCYTASDFKTILKYLPNVPDLRANFHRSAFGTYELVKPIFFVVEGHDHIFESALEAQAFHISTGDPSLGVYALANRKDAEHMLNIDHLVAQHLEETFSLTTTQEVGDRLRATMAQTDRWMAPAQNVSADVQLPSSKLRKTAAQRCLGSEPLLVEMCLREMAAQAHGWGSGAWATSRRRQALGIHGHSVNSSSSSIIRGFALHMSSTGFALVAVVRPEQTVGGVAEQEYQSSPENSLSLTHFQLLGLNGRDVGHLQDLPHRLLNSLSSANANSAVVPRDPMDLNQCDAGHPQDLPNYVLASLSSVNANWAVVPHGVAPGLGHTQDLPHYALVSLISVNANSAVVLHSIADELEVARRRAPTGSSPLRPRQFELRERELDCHSSGLLGLNGRDPMDLKRHDAGHPQDLPHHALVSLSSANATSTVVPRGQQATQAMLEKPAELTIVDTLTEVVALHRARHKAGTGRAKSVAGR